MVHLVDRDDDGDFGGLSVVDRLDGLRLHLVIGGNNQHHEVRGLCAPCPHFRERLVAGRVEEGDFVGFGLNVVGTDVLGDAPGFSIHH